MGLARAANLPVILVGDIDRGGLLAHLFGTVAVLEPEDQQLIAGFVVNKFRGDPALLAPGLRQLETLTGRPTYGVLPYDDGLWLDTEDSVSVLAHRVVGRAAAAARRRSGCGWRRSGCRASRTPPTSRRWPASPACWCAGSPTPPTWPTPTSSSIPGSKATVADLGWLRDRGLADGIVAHAGAGRPVLGICGGFQMLCRRIDDAVESGARGVSTVSACSTPTSCSRRTRRCAATRPRCTATRSITARSPAPPRTTGSVSESERGAVYGTHWHGLFDNDEFRRRWLAEAARPQGGRVHRRRRRRRPGAARRTAGPDGRPAGRTPRRRRDPRVAGERPAATAGDRHHTRELKPTFDVPLSGELRIRAGALGGNGNEAFQARAGNVGRGTVGARYR